MNEKCFRFLLIIEELKEAFLANPVRSNITSRNYSCKKTYQHALQGTIIVISNDPPFKDGITWFTTVPFKHVLVIIGINQWCVYLVLIFGIKMVLEHLAFSQISRFLKELLTFEHLVFDLVDLVEINIFFSVSPGVQEEAPTLSSQTLGDRLHPE